MPPQELLQLFQDLKLDRVHIQRPTKFIFFCGGTMDNVSGTSRSLRHYLLRNKFADRQIVASVKLAEQANQLYRDTTYGDLITFEEDIARIAALIVLVAESAGSLAELGAFAAIEPIRRKLVVLIQSEHSEAESFVRYGPIEKLIKEDDRRVLFYPWRLNSDGTLEEATAEPHVSDMIDEINTLITRVPTEELYRSKFGIHDFVVILWILYLAHAIQSSDLFEYVSKLINITRQDLNNKLYCMKLAGWVAKESYGGKIYWFTVYAADPISRYAFLADKVRDPLRRKSDVVAAIKADLKLSRNVWNIIAQKKVGSA